MQGKIIKGIAGFYYVRTDEGETYACKAKGIFRKDHTKPLVGDNVGFSVTDEKDMEGSIHTIEDRKNALIRPAVANIDQVVIVAAGKTPDFHLSLFDRLAVTMEFLEIPIVVCITKNDLLDGEERENIRGLLSQTGYPVYFLSNTDPYGNADEESFRGQLKGRVTAFAGASGVGKSSLVNRICPGASMETGELSRKIARGKQTTRHTELFDLGPEGGYILDTPGFSSVELWPVTRDKLELCFPEFSPYLGKCRFSGCAHLAEPDCAVKEQVGIRINPLRYEDYAAFYEELPQPVGATAKSKA